MTTTKLKRERQAIIDLLDALNKPGLFQPLHAKENAAGIKVNLAAPIVLKSKFKGVF